MAKNFTNLFCVFVVISISLVFNSSLLLAQVRRTGDDVRETAMELQRLIREKQAEGMDVSRALELDRQSKRAMRKGDPDECLRLLQKAIVLLGRKQNKEQMRTLLTNQAVSAFVMIHFEAGGDKRYSIFQEIVKQELNLGPEHINTRSLNYQKALWPTAIQLVDLANKYNFKLTLAFNPQWAKFILKDEEKIRIVGEWQKQGHEIAFHHHGINHIDWNGYTNRFKTTPYKDDYKYLNKYNSSDYRGTANDGFEWIKNLNSKVNSPSKVITGCIADTKIDKPDDITILTAGSIDLSKDLISRPRKQSLPEGEIIWIRHAQLRSNFNEPGSDIFYNEQQNYEKSKELLKKFKRKYKEAGDDDIVGVVFHLFDFYRSPDIYEELFKFFQSQGLGVEAVRGIIKNYF